MNNLYKKDSSEGSSTAFDECADGLSAPPAAPLIMILGVGGGGGNAVQYMYRQGFRDVLFAVANTDAQALYHPDNPVPLKLQLGSSGCGAGAKPEVAAAAAEDCTKQIEELLQPGLKMLFITAGMGGGTGTGASPVIAAVAKAKGILTVAIVTKPFAFEGKAKLQKAEQGIRQLREHCDIVLVILNEKLKEVAIKQTVRNAFEHTDKVLCIAAKSIVDLITIPEEINVDFEDVRTVIEHAGSAVIGFGEASGDNRATEATAQALYSSLLEYQSIQGATKVLLSVSSGPQAELRMDELQLVTDLLHKEVGGEAEVILGHGYDQTLGNKIRVTLIITGFSHTEKSTYQASPTSPATEKQVPAGPAAYVQALPADIPMRGKRDKGLLDKLHHREDLRHRAESLLNSLAPGDGRNRLSDATIKAQQEIPAYVRQKRALSYVPPVNQEVIRYSYEEQEAAEAQEESDALAP